METVLKALSSLFLSFLLLALLGNIIPSFPRLPWDIYLDKFGFKIYLPFISAIVLAALLTYTSGLFMHQLL